MSISTMAGKFLLLEEVAVRMGKSVEDVQRLVDRKKLFPIRDGATLKFRLDAVEQLVEEGAEIEAGETPATITVKVDLLGGDAKPTAAPAGSAGDGESNLGEPAESSSLELELDADALPAASVFSNAPAGDDDLAQTMLGPGGDALDLESMELDLESIVAASDAGRAGGSAVSAAASSIVAPAGSGALDLDLSDATGGVAGLSSLVVGSGPDKAGRSGSRSGVGSALSGALDQGLSLEKPSAISGIDLGPLDGDGGGDDGATALAGDEFDLGDKPAGDDDGSSMAFDVDEPLGDDGDSASVVAVEGSGESSFFGDAAGESSEFSADLIDAAIPDAVVGPDQLSVVPDTRFSMWQVVGLVCCSLLMLTGGFLMFDLMLTIGSTGNLTLTSPLLNPMKSVFGW